MKPNRIPLLLAAAVIAVAPAQPQDTSAATALEEIRERLERLERQNAQLQEHLRLLERVSGQHPLNNHYDLAVAYLF